MERPGTESPSGTDGERIYTAGERAMVDYALRWVNHGGGPDADILTRFDMSAREFYRKVIALLDRDPGSIFRCFGMSPVMVTRIKAVARRRIWISS